jgi:crossover junction endodeoxyribonuclease RuvC
MIVLGIDPGIAITGYGIIKIKGNALYPIQYGAIRTEAELPLPARLKTLYGEIEQTIKAFRPSVMAIEELFFNKNAKTALTVGQARGVAILAGVNSGLEILEYTPLQVKQAVCGYGRADKIQVGQMVKTLLGLYDVPKPDDTADALAIAICHAFSYQMNERLKF